MTTPLLAGLVVSCGCALGGMYFLHRLVELDFVLSSALFATWVYPR